MKIQREILIDQLVESTMEIMNEIEKLQDQPISRLNWKKSSESWSVLECIEHLNRYGEFYNPEISKRIEGSKKDSKAEIFHSGIIGNYFAKSMLPKEKLNKMKTFKDKNPVGSDLNKDVIHRFIEQQKEFLTLLGKARNLNLTKVKTSISISNLVKLRLGDTFRFNVNHNLRHLAQIKRALNQQ